jgi:hypothetical protein
MIFVLLGANFMMMLAIIFKLGVLPPQIPLFYSRPDGEQQLGEWWYIFLIPLLLNLLYISNKVLVKKFFADNPFATSFFNYLNLFLIVAFTIIFLKIVFLVS